MTQLTEEQEQLIYETALLLSITLNDGLVYLDLINDPADALIDAGFLVRDRSEDERSQAGAWHYPTLLLVEHDEFVQSALALTRVVHS